LSGSFDRVLVLVTGGSWLHRDPVLLAEVMTGLRGVFGRACVTSDASDVVAVELVVLDDLCGGSEEACAGFIGNEDCVDIPTEGVFE
jgi:hypothetical protein